MKHSEAHPKTIIATNATVIVGLDGGVYVLMDPSDADRVATITGRPVCCAGGYENAIEIPKNEE